LHQQDTVHAHLALLCTPPTQQPEECMGEGVRQGHQQRQRGLKLTCILLLGEPWQPCGGWQDRAGPHSHPQASSCVSHSAWG
jgi:hypothetical protein